jgi:ABC-type nitrate/sulfonate/bicarbonate transport system permease component
VARLPVRKEALVSFAALIVLWQLMSLFFPPYLVPGVQEIARKFVELLGNGRAWQAIVVTILRILGGLALGFAIGLALGAAMGLSRSVEAYAKPLLHFVMGVPALCWTIVAIIWFANVELRVLFVMLVVAFPVFTIQILDAIHGVQKDLSDMLLSFRPTPQQYFGKLIVPTFVPAAITAWKVNLGYAARVEIVAELVGASVGVGNSLLRAQELFDMGLVIAWTLVLSFFLLLGEFVIGRLEGALLAWRPALGSGAGVMERL